MLVIAASLNDSHDPHLAPQGAIELPFGSSAVTLSLQARTHLPTCQLAFRRAFPPTSRFFSSHVVAPDPSRILKWPILGSDAIHVDERLENLDTISRFHGAM